MTLKVVFHKELFESGRWNQLSIFDQMGNIGAEVGRAMNAKETGETRSFEGALARMCELFDMTVADRRWRGHGTLKEICRAREVVLDFLVGDNEYHTTKEFLDDYFGTFAVTANEERRAKRLKKSVANSSHLR